MINENSNILSKNEIIITVGKLADLFNVETRTIQLWAKKKTPMPKHEDGNYGEYNLLKSLAWRINFLENEIEELGQASDKKLNELRREDQELKNVERWQKIEKAAGNLVETKSTQIAWQNEQIIYKANSIAKMHELAIELDGVIDLEERREILLDGMNEVLNKIGDLKINIDEINIDEMDIDEIDTIGDDDA